ncbi:MAG: cytochrome c maturation protein CcmE [Dehalococcoidales bacterium]
MRRRKFLIGGLIIFLAVGYLGYIGFHGAATYYYTVSELLEQGDSVYSQTVRVNGLVAPGSVEQEAAGRILRFTIIDVTGEESLPVVYQGTVPDTFKVGNEVVIEGYLNSAGIFQAHTLMPKCPSRYVPEK